MKKVNRNVYLAPGTIVVPVPGRRRSCDMSLTDLQEGTVVSCSYGKNYSQRYAMDLKITKGFVNDWRGVSQKVVRVYTDAFMPASSAGLYPIV